jgi:DNA-binding beta-propeller fold protein YncE
MPVREAARAAMAAAVACVLLPAASIAQARNAAAPAEARTYDVLVGAEAVDLIQRLRFDGTALRIVREHTIGKNVVDPDGPHGMGVSPNGGTYFVSTAHGVPDGTLWKYDAATDAVLGTVDLGAFPATLQVSPDGYLVWVVNFNLHGEMVPSSVSVVDAERMVEVTRIETCTMPHGSRLSPDGSHHYSVCMMDDVLVDIDATTFEVARHFLLGAGAEHGMPGAPAGHRGHAGGHDGHGSAEPAAQDGRCSPTWAQPSPDGRTVWVACNRSSDLVAVDVASWTMRRRVPTGAGTYNLAATRDGRYVIGTNKRGQSISVHDAATGAEVARIPTSRRVPSGLVVSADDRYVFVTCEGVGSEPGAVDVFDLRTMTRVASADVGQMVGGIDVVPGGEAP